MRVITGQARGKKLITLQGKGVRPTSDRVKEAVFSVIQFDIEGRRFLDLFAGSGQMGIEALSRGALHATFVDSSRTAIDVIKKNLISTNLFEKATVICSEYTAALKSAQRYDVAYIDPPYYKGLLGKALLDASENMSDAGVILCEHPEENPVPGKVGDFQIVKQYSHAKIMVTLYRRVGGDNEKSESYLSR